MSKAEYITLIRKNLNEIQAALGKSPCDIYFHGMREGTGYRTIPAVIVSMDIRNSCRFLSDTANADFIIRANRELLSFTQVSTYFKLLGDGGLFIAEPEELAAHGDTLLDYLISMVQVFKEESEKAGYDLGYGCSITYGELHKYELFGETACLLYRDYLGYALNHCCRLTAVAGKNEILIGNGVDAVLDIAGLCRRYPLSLSPLELPPGSLKGMSPEDHQVQVLRLN